MNTHAAIAIILSAASAAFAQPGGGYTATPVPSGQHPTILPPTTDSVFDISWSTIDGSGGSMQSGGITLDGTVAQPDAGVMAIGSLELIGGFQVSMDEAPPCYANCDNSTVAPILNANDFQCFMNRYIQGTPYANCDNSTATPILNVVDFQCFMNKFAVGCS